MWEAAKCPCCGADIQVESELEKTFCAYCGSQIISKAAVAFGRVEIVGSVEVKGIKTTDKEIEELETLYALGEYKRAFNSLENFLDKNASDWRGWWCLAKWVYADNHRDMLSNSTPFKHALKLADDEGKAKIKAFYESYQNKIRASTVEIAKVTNDLINNNWGKINHLTVGVGEYLEVIDGRLYGINLSSTHAFVGEVSVVAGESVSGMELGPCLVWSYYDIDIQGKIDRVSERRAVIWGINKQESMTLWVKKYRDYSYDYGYPEYDPFVKYLSKATFEKYSIPDLAECPIRDSTPNEVKKVVCAMQNKCIRCGSKTIPGIGICKSCGKIQDYDRVKVDKKGHYIIKFRK